MTPPRSQEITMEDIRAFMTEEIKGGLFPQVLPSDENLKKLAGFLAGTGRVTVAGVQL